SPAVVREGDSDGAAHARAVRGRRVSGPWRSSRLAALVRLGRERHSRARPRGREYVAHLRRGGRGPVRGARAGARPLGARGESRAADPRRAGVAGVGRRLRAPARGAPPRAPGGLARRAAAVVGCPPESLGDVVAHVRGRSRLALAARDPRAAAYLAAVARTAEFVNTLS